MTQRVFERWNWETDCGESPLPADAPLPPTWAVAFYDRNGHLYRAISRVKLLADAPDNDPRAFNISYYDYYCNSDGRIIQKRALDDNRDVEVIVDFNYDLEHRQVTETAWWPGQDACKSRTHPMKGAS